MMKASLPDWAILRPGKTPATRLMRKVCVIIVGTLVLAVGIAMIVLPGPAVVVIPLGLAILSLEFVWAQRLLDYFVSRAQTVLKRKVQHHDVKEQGAKNDEAPPKTPMV